MEIKFEDIKPCGNFDSILIQFRSWANEVIDKCHEKKKFNKDLAKVIKTIVGDFDLIEILEEGHTTGETWNLEENMLCLLYAHLIIIDLNQTAHTYLNAKLDWDSPKKQLQDFIKDNKIYKDIKIV